ncbi:MAG TPA: hypothetical protein VJV39_12400 [Dongiaceae bacterium]|nr:hypothetical protein [Dongiaceae bacterium]
MRQGLHSIAAILVAAAIATVLAPLLFYTCTMPVWPESLAELYNTPLGPLYAALDGVLAAPLVFAGLFAAAVLLGAAFSRLRVGHGAVYLAAGAAVSLVAAFLAPLLLGELDAMRLTPELGSVHRPAVLAATAVAGLIDGAVFWLIVRHFDSRAIHQDSRT